MGVADLAQAVFPVGKLDALTLGTATRDLEFMAALMKELRANKVRMRAGGGAWLCGCEAHWPRMALPVGGTWVGLLGGGLGAACSTLAGLEC